MFCNTVVPCSVLVWYFGREMLRLFCGCVEDCLYRGQAPLCMPASGTVELHSHSLSQMTFMQASSGTQGMLGHLHESSEATRGTLGYLLGHKFTLLVPKSGVDKSLNQRLLIHLGGHF